MSSGKRKGSAFEREIICSITKAFRVPPQEATRSILSGGHEDAFGDITMSSALAKKFPFAIECKFWRQINLHDLFVPWEVMPKSDGRFHHWWLQTIGGALKCGRAPLLVFKANNQPILCAAMLSDLHPEVTKQLRWGPYAFTHGPRRPSGSMHKIIVAPWEDLLKLYAQVQKKGKK